MTTADQCPSGTRKNKIKVPETWANLWAMSHMAVNNIVPISQRCHVTFISLNFYSIRYWTKWMHLKFMFNYINNLSR